MLIFCGRSHKRSKASVQAQACKHKHSSVTRWLVLLKQAT